MTVKRSFFSQFVLHVLFSHLCINSPDGKNGCNKFERTNSDDSTITGIEYTSNPHFVCIKKGGVVDYLSTLLICMASN